MKLTEAITPTGLLPIHLLKKIPSESAKIKAETQNFFRVKFAVHNCFGDNWHSETSRATKLRCLNTFLVSLEGWRCALRKFDLDQ